MILKVLSVSTVAILSTFVSARAETIVFSASRTARIQGHDAYSRFLPGAFDPVPTGWTDGSQSQGPAIEQGPAATGTTPQLTDQRSPAPSLVQSLVQAELPPGSGLDTTSGSTRGNGEGAGPGDGLGPLGGGPSKGVGTVPLPPAFPMLGAALLLLGALGWFARGRRATDRA